MARPTRAEAHSFSHAARGVLCVVRGASEHTPRAAWLNEESSSGVRGVQGCPRMFRDLQAVEHANKHKRTHREGARCNRWPGQRLRATFCSDRDPGWSAREKARTNPPRTLSLQALAGPAIVSDVLQDRGRSGAGTHAKRAPVYYPVARRDGSWGISGRSRFVEHVKKHKRTHREMGRCKSWKGQRLRARFYSDRGRPGARGARWRIAKMTERSQFGECIESDGTNPILLDLLTPGSEVRQRPGSSDLRAAVAIREKHFFKSQNRKSKIKNQKFKEDPGRAEYLRTRRIAQRNAGNASMVQRESCTRSHYPPTCAPANFCRVRHLRDVGG